MEQENNEGWLYTESLAVSDSYDKDMVNRHAEERHQQNLRHQDDRHKQIMRHAEEVHKHNLGIAKEHHKHLSPAYLYGGGFAYNTVDHDPDDHPAPSQNSQSTASGTGSPNTGTATGNSGTTGGGTGGMGGGNGGSGGGAA